MLKQLIKEDSGNGMTEKVFKIRHAIMYFNHRFCTFCNFLDIHRYLSKIDCSRHISLQKNPFQQDQVLELATKEAAI